MYTLSLHDALPIFKNKDITPLPLIILSESRSVLRRYRSLQAGASGEKCDQESVFPRRRSNQKCFPDPANLFLNASVFFWFIPGEVAFGIGRSARRLSIIDHKLGIVENVSLPQWRSFIEVWTGKNTQGRFRKFGEGLDERFIYQRTVAIWEAQETMERGVSERDNASALLA
jgi:hypothetical protein